MKVQTRRSEYHSSHVAAQATNKNKTHYRNTTSDGKESRSLNILAYDYTICVRVSTLDRSTISIRSFHFCRKDRARCTTSVGFLGNFFCKHILFLVIHIAQANPTKQDKHVW
jgi:hypothetical protein